MRRLILFILALCATVATRAATEIDFRHVNFQSTDLYIKAKAICEDNHGFIYIGTHTGLHRYDGYVATPIEINTDLGVPLSKLSIEDVEVDQLNRIWCATNLGLCIFDSYDNKIELLKQTRNIPCTTIEMLPSGDAAVGSQSGLFIYSMEGELVEKYNRVEGFDSTLSNNIVRSILADDKGALWVGTYDGLNLIDRERRAIKRIQLDLPTRGAVVGNNLILDIEWLGKDKQRLAIGTEQGLCIFDTADLSYTTLSSKNTGNKLSSNIIKTIYVESSNVWCGTDFGLDIYNYEENSIESYFCDYYNFRSISDNIIWDIFHDSRGNIWFATDSGVDLIYNTPAAKGRNRINYTMPPLRGGVNANNISLDKRGDMWLATNQGVIHYDCRNRRYETIAPPQILHSKVNDILCTNDGWVWIASAGGLNLLNERTGEIKSYIATRGEQSHFANNYIYNIRQSNEGTVCCNVHRSGIYQISRDESGGIKTANFRNDAGDQHSISSDTIFNIEFDSHSNLWAAHINGLDKLNGTTGQFEQFVFDASHPESGELLTIKALTIGYDDTVCVATDSGAYCLNSESGTYSLVEGSEDHDISDVESLSESLHIFVADNLLYILKSGRLINIPNVDLGVEVVLNVKKLEGSEIVVFGNENFTSLNIDDFLIPIVENPQPRLTYLSINNQIVTPNTLVGKRQLIDRDIDCVEQIELNYDENVISLGISSLQYGTMQSVRYEYMLEGSSNKWLRTPRGVGEITLNYLTPGHYKLRILAPNKYGEYAGVEKVLSIIINPPLYRSSTAIVIYLIILLVVIVVSLLYFKGGLIRRERVKQERENQRLERERSEQLVEVKSRFFTNISHELKTPLTLISGPIDDMLRDPDISDRNRRNLQLSKRNIDRLKRLVNQILDFRRIEKRAVSLDIQYYDIVEFCSRIVTLFNDEAVRDNLFLDFSSTIGSKYMWFDSDKVDKIIFNLLSNAIKFTDEGGKIDLALALSDDGYIVVSISDTGCGIHPDYQPYLFERFNTLNTNNHSDQSGSGIGLSLVKEYVDMHNGTIQVESELGRGSTFTFTLPLDRSKLGVETTAAEQTSQEVQEEVAQSQQEEMTQEEVVDPEIDLPVVLIVEDNHDMREYIDNALSQHYTTLMARDGVEGLQMAIQHLPDLILSDVMMPHMDGLELCKRVKSDLRCSNIPILLLTAKSDLDSKKEGVNVGASGYVAKPFDMDYLLARVSNLIGQRELMEKRIRLQHLSTPTTMEVASSDERFINELVEIIEREIDNPNFNVAELSSRLSTSPASLYRRIKSVAGESVSEFIRGIRLKRAGQLLRESKLNISEVMFMVGFSNHSYFARSFKNYYGVLPKEYQKSNSTKE
ncbi:MAG: ATP-binding protein [Rikenellaceae bacterium]